MFDRRLVSNFDWVLLFTVLLLAGAGIINLFSASSSLHSMATPLYLKQLLWLSGGVTIALLICLFDYRHLEHFAVHFYGLSVGMLIYVLLVGKTAMGAARWIDLGVFNVQPGEVIKIAMILLLARIFAKTANPLGYNLVELWVPALWLFLPVVLILKEPDLGTAVMVLFIAGTMLLFAGIKRATLISLGIIGVLVAIAGWFGLHDYQRARIRTFMNPEADPLGSGYHIIQSKIAVGSGGFWGKGFVQGTQSQLSFLPERHTDFAFSVFAEEWGFVGSFTLLFVYLFLIVWGLYIARRAADRFGLFLAVGVTAMIFWHIVVNLGMVIGLLPVVGVPLPLFSYGGTSMVTTMIGVGLLMNVSMRRFMF
ncbi:cell elongation-specific peptidoglycan biosynthesis regulator RodA [Desulfuromusa kysingii]|uniref:Peptidoglycan glycosyltransferase RodA n=1 Tax=Desulfuromusa kysingii TaxID=37625 RepID=A0A1H4C4A3_9BACT|nr:rod shape-determining protein RodA [Desulfuromusa kysingii]SEA55180.1 cell elongation-specific peptidoglycan biosynthesis regulator RodA [Desulfuromusa kysingii]